MTYKPMSPKEWEKACRYNSNGHDPIVFENNLVRLMTHLYAICDDLIAGKSDKWVAKKYGFKLESIEYLRNELKTAGNL